MSAVYPTSYPLPAAGYPGVYCDFGLYPYPVAYRRGCDDGGGYYTYDRRYTEATQRLRSYYGSGDAARSVYELSPSSASPPEVTARIPAASSCRLATSSESSVDKMAATCSANTEAAARNHAYAAGYVGNGKYFGAAPQRGGNSSPPTTGRRTSSSSSSSTSSCVADSGAPHRVPASTAKSSPAAAPVNLAGGGTGSWTERRTVIMGDVAAELGHHHHQHQQSVIRRRTRPHDAYNPPPTVADLSQQHPTTCAGVRLYESIRDRQTAVTSTNRCDYQRLQLKAAATSQPTPPVYPSLYCPPSQLDHHTSTSSPDDHDDVEEDFTVAAMKQQFLAAAAAGTADVRPYMRAAAQRHVTSATPGHHVTAYTSVIVDTQQHHAANGYVH